MGKKLNALFMVTLAFITTLVAARIVLASPASEWQVAGHNFVLYLVIMAVAVAFMAMARKDPSAFGLTLVNVKNDMKVIAICIVPVIALAIALFAIGWKSWEGTLLVSGIEVLILFLIGKLLANVPAGDGKVAMSTLVLTIALPFGMVGGIAASFIYYFILVGPAEELLFRGYIQSRLNEAFGRPYRFFGVSWGAGIIVASLLFGLWHVLNPFNPITSDFSLAWQWGLWTFFLGLILGFIREKTNGLTAPAILHGALNFF